MSYNVFIDEEQSAPKVGGAENPRGEEVKMKPYLDIATGSHTSASMGMCIMEAVAYFVGEKHTDTPQCTSPTIGKAMISFNDQFPFKDNAERTETLLPLIPVVVGTQTNFEDEATRAFIAADFACRVFAPIAFKVVGFLDWAEKLKNLKPVVDKETATAAANAANAAAAAYYAGYAAFAAASANATAKAAAHVANTYYAATNTAGYTALGAANATATNAATTAATTAGYTADIANAASAAYYAAKAAPTATASEIHEAIKLAFAEMIKRMSELGTKKMELSAEAKIEFEAACHLAKAHD